MLSSPVLAYLARWPNIEYLSQAVRYFPSLQLLHFHPHRVGQMRPFPSASTSSMDLHKSHQCGTSPPKNRPSCVVSPTPSYIGLKSCLKLPTRRPPERRLLRVKLALPSLCAPSRYTCDCNENLADSDALAIARRIIKFR